MQKLSVVILNYNGVDFLKKFLKNVIECSKPYPVIVVDNCSTDSSLEFLTKYFPSTEVIKLDKNLGYTGGYNVALKQIKSSYYVLLNSDVEVTPNWIPPVLDFMENNPNVVACQPKIKDFNRKNHFEYAGAAGGLIDKHGYPFCRGRIFNHLEEDFEQYNDFTEIFWASGACLFILASAFHEQEGFDNDFFAHMEEIDLCWRLKNADYKIYFIPNSTVYHVGGGTLNSSSAFKTFLNFRNNLVLLYKNLPKGSVVKTLLMRFFLDGLAWTNFILKGRFKHAFAITKAYWKFYTKINFWRKKRKKIKQQKKVTKVFNKSVVFLYFAKKKKTWKELKN